MRIKHAVWTLVPVLGLATPAYSQGTAVPRYTYGEIGYVHADFDDINDDGDGWRIGGSVAIHPHFHIVADYQDIDLSGSSDAQSYGVGLGANGALRPGLDLYGRVRWIHAEFGHSDDDGYGLETGLRFMINPQLELNGGVKYVNVGDNDDTSLQIGGLYEIVRNFALGADVEVSDNVTAFFLKGRLYFGDPGRR